MQGRDKLGRFAKGHVTWCEGKTDIFSEEVLEKMREKHRGISTWSKGKTKKDYPQLGNGGRKNIKLTGLEKRYLMAIKNLLWYWYYYQKKSRTEMAEILQISQAYIQKLFKRYNLQMRSTSESLKGKTGWTKGLTKDTDERIRKISETLKGLGVGDKNPFYGKHHTEKTKIAMGGEKHHNWKGGITPLTRKIRTCFKYRQWRSDIFTKDDFTCQDCDRRGLYLHAHHIMPFADILELNDIKNLEQAIICEELWNINNGITLCEECHNKTKKGRRIKEVTANAIPKLVSWKSRYIHKSRKQRRHRPRHRLAKIRRIIL